MGLKTKLLRRDLDMCFNDDRGDGTTRREIE